MSFFSMKEKWMTDNRNKADKAIASLNKAEWDELLRASSEAPIREVADAAAGILKNRIKNTESSDPFYIGHEELKVIACRGREDIVIPACRQLIWDTTDFTLVAKRTPHPAVASAAVEELARKMEDGELEKIAVSSEGHEEARLLAVEKMQEKKALETVAQEGASEAVRKAAAAKTALILEAEDPATSPKRLEELVKEEQLYAVLVAVAHNPSAPASVLSKLADNRTRYNGVRNGVASNPSTPPKEVARILREGGWADETTRYCLAKNPSTPPDTLKELTEDREEYIRDLAKKNPNYPKG